jgi:hypothetical protein
MKKATSKDIVNAYKFILGRLPEDEGQIKRRAGKVTVEELRREFLYSVEFEKLYTQKNFSLNIPKRTLKSILKAFLKPKLIRLKGFVKKHPILFWAAKLLLRFFPERIRRRLRGLQAPQTAPALLPQSAIPHPVDNVRAKYIYDQLNTACDRIRSKGI